MVYANQLKEVVLDYFQLLTEYRKVEDPVMKNNISSEIESFNVVIQNVISKICSEHSIQVEFTQDENDQNINICYTYSSLS